MIAFEAAPSFSFVHASFPSLGFALRSSFWSMDIFDLSFVKQNQVYIGLYTYTSLDYDGVSFFWQRTSVLSALEIWVQYCGLIG